MLNHKSSVRVALALYLQPERCKERNLRTGEVINEQFCNEYCPAALRDYCNFWWKKQMARMRQEGGQ